jgi:hypothetical protein
MNTMSRSLALAATILIGPQTSAFAEYFVTDLVDAAKRNDGHAVHRLIEEGTDLSATDASGYTALHWASVRGNWRIFRELVAAGAPVNAVGGDGGTPMHWACHHDRADMVLLLIDNGGDIGVQNRWGRSPLHVAARRGCGEVAALLIEKGADPNTTTREGWTTLHVASLSGHPAMIELLEAGGADPTLTDAEGHTAAEVARQRPPEIAAEPSRLGEFTGIYDLGGGFSTKIWLEGDHLKIREFAPDELYPIDKDRFFCRQEPWTVQFVRDPAGAVSSVELHFLRRTVTGARTSTPRYVGSRVCMDCHSGPEQGQQDILWMRGRHAHAYWNLAADWALFLAKLRPHYQDLVSPIDDQRCLLCHVAGAQDPDSLFAESFRPEEGVSCEACHGPGSEYIEPEAMANREAFLAAGGRIPTEDTCRSCHRNSERFSWAEWAPKIAHPLPVEETKRSSD